MKLQSFSVSALVALLTGIAQCYFLVFCWAYIGAYSPLLRWLLDLGLRGIALRVSVFPIDFITSVIISLPAAFLLLRLRPSQLRLYLLLAVVPGFVWLNWNLIGTSLPAHFADSPAPGWLSELFALPAAAWLLRFMLGLSASNHSPKWTRKSHAA